MGETVDALGYRADVPGRAKEKVSGTVTSVKDKIAGTASSVGGSASSAASSVGDATPGKQDIKRAAGVAQENPAGLLIGAAAVGFIAGLLIPSTAKEHEKIGPMADQVKDKVRETGQEALEHGKAVAQETAQNVTQTAKETVQESGQQHAQELKDTAQQNAQDARQGVSSQSPSF